MASKYGMPWCGSKSTIAEWIIDLLPAADTFVDLFAGGCAVTHCAMLSGKYERFICNDISGSVDVFMRAINGEFADYDYVPTREEFFSSDDLAVKMLYSFGNNFRTYLWGGDIEKTKIYASRMISAPTMHERRMEYMKFVKCLKSDGFPENLERLNGLESIERLERLEALKCICEIDRIDAYSLDYRSVSIPDCSVVYADPPYRNADKSARYRKISGDFDNDEFEIWLNEVNFPVFVSEENAPRGCVPISFIEKTRTFRGDSQKKVNEGLFLQERFLPWYEKIKAAKEAV